MIDYIFVSKRFRSSVLDTRVYHSTSHEYDHELVVSTFRFKIKVKRRRTGTLRYQTSNIPVSCQVDYRSVLAESFSISDQTQTSSSNALCSMVPSYRPMGTS